MELTIYSFGFKYRQPPANYYFDVGWIKNPAREKKWDLHTKANDEMRGYVLRQEHVEEFIQAACKLILIALEADDGVRVAFGCSAGRHRSPIIAEEVRRRIIADLAFNDLNAKVEHLELE
jgi:UPF0042 nucleotide-binding protein